MIGARPKSRLRVNGASDGIPIPLLLKNSVSRAAYFASPSSPTQHAIRDTQFCFPSASSIIAALAPESIAACAQRIGITGRGQTRTAADGELPNPRCVPVGGSSALVRVPYREV